MRIVLAALLLTACSPATEAPLPAESPATEISAAASPARDSCKDIAALAAAMTEPEPFTSLRSGLESNGQFATAVSPSAATCTFAKMEALGPDGGDVHVANCLVFSSGMLDREANAPKAKAAFDATRSDLDKCLPKDWTSRDGSQADANATEVMIYESAADEKRSMDASSYLYPVELRKEWSEGDRANPPGWRVTLNFQKEIAARPAPDQQ